MSNNNNNNNNVVATTATTASFSCSNNLDEVDETTTTTHGILCNVIRENGVVLGGSSIGKGLTKAASYQIGLDNNDDNDDAYDSNNSYHYHNNLLREDAFYVVDIGVIVSQVYQWKKYFPNVEAFYAVKCNPDPVIVRTLAVLGLNFDCASKNEIQIVKQCSQDLTQQPQIIFANPCKGPSHIREALLDHGVYLMTFDNVNEVIKCANISSKDIKLIMRIMTDDRGSTSRLSSKFGAPRIKWRPLLAAAKKHGIEVVGVSFHVGSGCRDATKYDLALQDAREIFDMAQQEFGFHMTILDIGGGFPGETHSLWNPAEQDDNDDEDDEDPKEGLEQRGGGETEDDVPVESSPLMFFQEIAESVAPAIEKYFPKESGVRVIGEPGRYIVAACATLCCSIIGIRDNMLDATFDPEAIDDKEAAQTMFDMSRDRESEIVGMASGSILQSGKKLSMGQSVSDDILNNLVEELADYSSLFARQNMAQQEVDTYNDSIDVYALNSDEAVDVLGVPEPNQEQTTQTVEGINAALVDGDGANPMVTLAAAGEAAVNGLVMQAVADTAALQDDFAIYINDGVYGAMNNIMFDHANLRPRVLRKYGKKIMSKKNESGMEILEVQSDSSTDGTKNESLFSTTVFGPTCDSIDVVARGVLLPKLEIGDWIYFQNMGAYTMAAASSFNGFTPTERMYVCSVQPEYFEKLIAGPE